MEYLSYRRCACGAITISTDVGTYSCFSRNRKKFFPGLDLRRIPRLQTTDACDHCVNHYGLDLCGCGSGNLFGHCDGGLKECKAPMQVIGGYERVQADDTWDFKEVNLQQIYRKTDEGHMTYDLFQVWTGDTFVVRIHTSSEGTRLHIWSPSQGKIPDIPFISVLGNATKNSPLRMDICPGRRTVLFEDIPAATKAWECYLGIIGDIQKL